MSNRYQGEVLFEMRPVGRMIRITAIDPVTGTEVIMVGDAKQSMTTLKRLAARKLAYVLKKKQAEALKNQPEDEY